MSAAPARSSSPGPAIDTPTEWTAVNACLLPAASLDGQEIITSEGLGSPATLHPVQQEMAVRGGSQCGYCTPGFVCSMAAEYYRPGPYGARADACDHEHGPNGFDLHALSGNLCRCTGYRPIRDAAYALGDPAADDALAARRTAPPPPPAADRGWRSAGRSSSGRRTSTSVLAAAGRPARRRRSSAGSTDCGVRGEPPRRPAAAGRRRGPAGRAARVRVRSRRGPDRRRADAERDRAAARRAGCRCWRRCSRSSPRG